MMDSFTSETVTSDSSTSQEVSVIGNKRKAQTRKMRRTEDIISLNFNSEDCQNDSKTTGKINRENIAFLPKINLAENAGQHVATKANKFKPKRSSLAKKTASFKIGKLMIERQFQNHKMSNTKRSKFPRIKLKLVNKGEQVNSYKKSKTPNKSDLLAQVLSTAVEDFSSGSEINVKDIKRKSKSLSRKSGNERNNESLQVVVKDPYVSLVPLEKTNLLNEHQIMQLKSKCSLTSSSVLRDANFNKHNYEVNRIKTSLNKENRFKTESPMEAKSSAKRRTLFIGRIEKSHRKKSVFCHENIAPCKVVLERLTLELIELLTLPKKSKIRLATILFKERNISTSSAVELKTSNTFSHSNISNLSTDNSGNSRKTRLSKISTKLIGNSEYFFNPEGTSSPLITEIPSLSQYISERDTVSCTSIIKSRKSSCKNETENATYEVEAGPSTRRSNSIRKGFEEFSQLNEYIPEGNTVPSTSINKSRRSSMKNETKNATYEVEGDSITRSSFIRKGFEELPQLSEYISERDTLPRTSIDESRKSSIQNETYELSKSDENSTFEVDMTNHSRISKLMKSTKLSKSNESVLTNSGFVSTENGKERLLCDVAISVVKKQRSNSYDAEQINTENINSDVLSNNLSGKNLSSENQNTFTGNISRKRRSTLTLEDSVNDIGLLKSICDASGTPQRLNKTEKGKSSLIKQALNNKSSSSNLDCSNITIRKHWTTFSDSVGESSKENKGLESISPPWSCEADSADFDISKTGDVKLLQSSLHKPSTSARNDSTEEEEEVEQFSLNNATRKSLKSSNGNNLSRQVKSVSYNEIIELSDDEESSSLSSLSSTSSSDNKKHLQKQGRRVTFEVDSVKKQKQKLPKDSLVRVSSPKSMIKNKTNKLAVVKNRRVTFSDMSIIIIDDSIASEGSSTRKSNIDLVPTNFPSDDELSDQSPQFNKKNTVECTPIQKHTESAKFSKQSALAQTQGCFQSPRVANKRIVSGTPIQLRKQVDFPSFNKTGTVGRTPLRLKTPQEDNNVSSTSSKLNKRISSGNQANLEKDLSIASSGNKNNGSKRTKMPNFASMHKKMFDKMLNLQDYSKRKEERAKLLLSGQKPAKVGSSSKKSPNKHLATVLQKKLLSKKQLKYDEPGVSRIANEHKFNKNAPLLVSSTPKYKKNERDGFTRYGFKVVGDNQSVPKKEQLMAVANKTRIPKSNTANKRTEIRGVRSNRRFDLLMKMRNKEQK